MEFPITNSLGQVIDTAEISDAVFGVPLNSGLVHQALVMYRLNKRQGTHDTKVRSEVSGGGRKPWPQKYTGRARQGSTRAPHWRHGGVAFGPRPRDHRVDMPRRMRHLALRCVLSEKVRLSRLILMDSISLDRPSTKVIGEVLLRLKVGSSALIVTRESDLNLVLSSRNLEKVWTLPVSLINAEQLLKREWVIMTLDAVRRAEELWATERPRRWGKKAASLALALGRESDEVQDGEESFNESP